MEASLEDQPNLATRQEDDVELAERIYLRVLGLQWNDLRGKTVLTIGAGDEAFASAAKTRGIQVVSVDTFAGGMRNTPDDSFDLIVSRTAVQSMADLQNDFGRLLNETKRVLKSGGEFRIGPGVLEPEFQTHEEYANRFRLIEDKVKGNNTISGKGRYVIIEGEETSETGGSHAHHVSKSDPGE